MSTEELPPRESMEFDVVIVGAGPSGLAAAIRLKQINPDLSVVVVEKGSEVGAHILSGAVIDPAGLDKLLTDWREDAECPLKTAVSEDRFFWNTAGSAIRLPSDTARPGGSALIERLCWTATRRRPRRPVGLHLQPTWTPAATAPTPSSATSPRRSPPAISQHTAGVR